MADTFSELKKEADKYGLLEAVLKTGIESTGLSSDELYRHVELIADSMISSVQRGLKSKELSSSKLSGECTSILLNAKDSPLVSPFNKKVMTYALAVIEENARMGKIAACPTAGSSGIVPAVLVASYEEFKKTKREFLDSLIIAGEIGRIISLKMPLAGAVAGCQAECGAASSMASGALCYLLQGDINQMFNAIALNLKNILGLTCDPVAGLVEVPCVKRNLFLASHAINAAYAAMAGIESKIPPDDVVSAMRETGNLMSPKLKESSEAGLALTPAGVQIINSLYEIWHKN